MLLLLLLNVKMFHCHEFQTILCENIALVIVDNIITKIQYIEKYIESVFHMIRPDLKTLSSLLNRGYALPLSCRTSQPNLRKAPLYLSHYFCIIFDANFCSSMAECYPGLIMSLVQIRSRNFMCLVYLLYIWNNIV